MIDINVSMNQLLPIVIGKKGENNTRRILFNITPFIRDYGNGSAVIIYSRPNASYPAPQATTQTGNTVEWVITSNNTAESGVGFCAILWYVNGGATPAKSKTFRINVLDALGNVPAEEPSDYDSWLERLTAIAGTATNASTSASASASSASASASSASTSASSASTSASSASTSASSALIYKGQAESAKSDAIAYAEGDNSRSIVGAKKYMEGAKGYSESALDSKNKASNYSVLANSAYGKAMSASSSASDYAEGNSDKGIIGAKGYMEKASASAASAQEYAENAEESATNAGYYSSIIESSAKQIADNKEYIEALNGIVENIRECNEEITEVTIDGFTVGTCYSATGYSSSPVYRCYSGFFDNDGGEYNFDATKFKMMFTYWNTKDQTARTNVGAWNTSSPAKIERTDIPYVRIQLEELTKASVDVTKIKVYETVDNTEVIVKKVLASETKVESHEEMLDELYNVTINELDVKNEKQGIPSSASKTFINFKNEYTHIAVKVRPYEEVSIKANANYPCYFCGLKSYTVPSAENINADYSDCSGWTERKTIAKGESLTIMIAEDIKYIVVVSKYQGNDYLPSSFKVYPHKIKWVALGDSITEGYYSPSNDEYSSEDPQHRDSALTYVSWVADIKGFTLDNRGVGGSGWMKRGTRQNPKLNAREQIDSFSDGFFKAYDLCTIMWGINDWKGNMNLGSFSDGTNPTTESVYGNMRYVIEKIYESNPSIKVIVITPLNSSRSNDADNPHSTADNNWALGYTGFNYNLNDLFNAIKQVCEYYQIEMIDETHESCVNRLNIESMMPDEVHPSQPAHRQIGIEIAGKIKYNG